MTLARRFVSFLSDYGHSDEFVGVCKSVMLSLAPDLQIIDITHDLPVHDVRAGALTLVRAAQYLPDGGIVLAVVDPGVGTDRRLVAVEVEHGILLGPDNGLLAPAVAILGGAQRVVSLTSTEHQLPAPGPTFAGRDVLAPAAAHLAAGVDPSELGDEVDAAGLVPGLVSLPQHDEGGRDPRRGVVDRSVRQLPAQHRSRRAACARRRARGADRGPLRRAGAVGAMGAHVRRRQAVGARAARRFVRPGVARPRPRLGRRRIRARTGVGRHPRATRRDGVGARPGAVVAMRPGTTIAIAVLLFIILAAAFAQFVLRLGP